MPGLCVGDCEARADWCPEALIAKAWLGCWPLRRAGVTESTVIETVLETR